MIPKIILRQVYTRHLCNVLWNTLYHSKMEKSYFHNIGLIRQKFCVIRYDRYYCTVVRNLKCWNCSKELEKFSFKCPHCNFLQTVDKSVNLFQILDQKVCYDVNIAVLKRYYLKLQAEFHPDKFSNSSADEKAISEEVSSIINKAYSILSNPYERGLYVLKLHNIPIKESDIQLDQHFLSKIMELNEELEEIKKQSDFEAFEDRNEDEITKLTQSISGAFSKNDFQLATLKLQKMKYFISIRDRLKAMKSSFY